MPGRVLIVDDDRDMCEVVAAALKKRKLEPQWFTSGAEVLEALRSDTCDVVISDLRMPELDGLDLCRRITE